MEVVNMVVVLLDLDDIFYSNLTIFDFLLGVLRGVEDPSFRSLPRQGPIYKPD